MLCRTVANVGPDASNQPSNPKRAKSKIGRVLFFHSAVHNASGWTDARFGPRFEYPYAVL